MSQTFASSAINVAGTGATISTTGTSAAASIPLCSSGEIPRYIRIASTVAACFRLSPLVAGVTAVPSAAGTGYIPTEVVTLTGGTAATQAKVTVQTTKLISLAINSAGGATGASYAPGDTVIPVGGVFSVAPTITVTHTKAISAIVVAGGTGGTNGAVTITGTTGTGTKFQATGTITGNALAGALVVSVAGDYTVNPTNINIEPVTGGSLSGCTVILVMGVLTSTGTGGVFTTNSATFTQASSSGAGTGATFQTAVYGANTLTVSTPGDYSVLPSNPVAQGSTTGSGTGLTTTMTYTQAGTVAVALTTDMQVQPGDATILSVPTGYTKMAAIQVAAAGVVQVSPLENM